MKRALLILICFLALFCALPAYAEEETPEFSFLLDGIDTPFTLSTAPEETVALLGEHAQFREESLESIGDFFTIVDDSGLSFVGVECARVVFSYYNDELMMISCYMTSAALPDAQPLIDEMNRRYGEGSENTDAGDLLLFASPPADWTWTFGENILIEYWHEQENAAFPHMLGFLNNPVVQKMEDAFNNLSPAWQSENAAGS